MKLKEGAYVQRRGEGLRNAKKIFVLACSYLVPYVPSFFFINSLIDKIFLQKYV